MNADERRYSYSPSLEYLLERVVNSDPNLRLICLKELVDNIDSKLGVDTKLPFLNIANNQKNPDAHWILVRDNQLVGRCSLWWRNTPRYPNQKLGFIGHYAVEDVSAAKLLLNHACEELAAFGCTLAVAPIDGSTWQRHRLLTERGDEPVFFLEPDNPDNWSEHFFNQGFTSFADYSSALNTDLSYVPPQIERVSKQLDSIGVQIRPINLEFLEVELQRIYSVAIASFYNNFLYTPITEAEFIAQYLPLLPYIKPELVLIAEHNQTPVGFLFAIPDWLQAQRGEQIDTVIIKTVAILPKRIYAGLGNVLVAKSQAIAHQLGFTRAIHALMHNANPSRNLSDRYARPIRRYTLFAKNLI